MPHSVRHGARGEMVETPSDAVGLAGRHRVAIGRWCLVMEFREV
jgi:hypothetical protein